MIFKGKILSGYVSGVYKLYNWKIVLLKDKWEYFIFSEMHKLWKKIIYCYIAAASLEYCYKRQYMHISHFPWW